MATDRKKPGSNNETSTVTRIDPVAFGRQLADIMQQAQPALKAAMDQINCDKIAQAPLDPLNVREAMLNVWYYWAQQPEKLLHVQLNYLHNWMDIYNQTTHKFISGEAPDAPVIAPEKGDRRFRDPAWQDNAVFDFMKQSYLLTGRLLHTLVDEADNISAKQRQRADFALKQFVDALAPNNFALLNPEVLKTTMETGGENLLRGLENLVEDLQRGHGQLKISKTDYTAFKVGKNLATTPGKVVFRNELFELIQYSPTTPQVDKTPLLVVPPWINKYYILDMRPDNSFVKWAVDQGLTVFIMSWVNPTADMAGMTFENYMNQGLFTAVDQVRSITGEPKVHAVGYCIGGTLLTTALAYATAKGTADRCASATFLTPLIDFRKAGELTLFTDDEQLDMLERDMAEKGYLQASALQQTFNMLRANDLIWSFVVNNYLLGKEPFPFDLLYWNDDSTNMPAAMHSYYLRNMYRENRLAKAGRMVIDGVPIDISKIKVPAYFMSTREDHIAPWEATFDGAQMLGGDVTFTLAASGHVAGVVNPPSSGKYCYWSSGKPLEHKTHQKAKDWLETSKMAGGSWWPHWRQWLQAINSKTVSARKPAEHKLGDAPGEYVRQKAA